MHRDDCFLKSTYIHYHILRVVVCNEFCSQKNLSNDACTVRGRDAEVVGFNVLFGGINAQQQCNASKLHGQLSSTDVLHQ